jgi:quercetin dioxygenase-like cupin family protein
MEYRFFLYSALLIIGLSGCGQMKSKQSGEGIIFPKGTRGSASNFTGVVWSHPLVPNNTNYNCIIGNVTFEPGARSNWHYHNSGQILLVTDGIGYYQEKGKPIELIKKGDVIECPQKVEHWHGASHNSPCTHIAIVPNTQNGIVKWLRPVTAREYNAGK